MIKCMLGRQDKSKFSIWTERRPVADGYFLLNDLYILNFLSYIPLESVKNLTLTQY